jgi:hypothetical protein
LKDITPFFEGSRVICVPFDENNENNEIIKIISNNYYMNDILVCGPCHKSYLRSKITNEMFLNYIPLNKGYTIDFDTFDSNIYPIFKFIEDFYKDINLNLTQFYDYFYIPTTIKSIEYFNLVRDYYVIFIQSNCSDGRKLNISNLVDKYLYDPHVILISSNENIYDIDNKIGHIETKYKICQTILLDSRIINYKDIILNSDEIYIIDSCFTAIVLPYLKTNQLKTDKVRIIYRDLVNNILL